MSFILIQVNNYAGFSGSPEQDSKSMTPQKCDIDTNNDVKGPYLTLNMSLRGHKSPEIKPFLDKSRLVYSLNHFNSDE